MMIGPLELALILFLLSLVVGSIVFIVKLIQRAAAGPNDAAKVAELERRVGELERRRGE